MDRPERDRHVLRVNRLYSAHEIARVLMVSEDTINKLAKAGEIPFVSLNGQRKYCGWQIRMWLDERAQGLSKKQEDGMEVS